MRIRNLLRNKWTVAAAMFATAGVGCVNSRNDVSYINDPGTSYYRDHATEIDYPAVEAPMSPEVAATPPPITVNDIRTVEIRDLALAEAIQTSLINSEIIRTAIGPQQNGNLLTNGDRAASVYDPAIQESGVLFGGRGVEAALSAFDAQFQASMIWGRDEQAQNNPFAAGLGGGLTFTQETGAFTSSLSKTFANGGSVSLNHNVNYRGTNSPSLFPSVYTGILGVQYQLPLLAGSGTEFTRIAGPIGQSFGGISGVSQGVIISRINNDIALADFESAVRDLVRDVENAYWDLLLEYQRYHIAVETRQRTFELRDFVRKRLEGGGGTGNLRVNQADLFQATDQYYAAEVAANNAQAGVFTAEIRLRRLMGLPTGDGELLRPIDSPVTAPFELNWQQSLTEALTQRVELRRQQWNIKSLQLQLKAAESLVQPRLDFVGGYNVNGFGDNLLGYNQPYLGNFYETVGTSNLTGWNLGFQMRWDIGFRSAKAQVRNYELRLAKAERVLLEQQKEISHDLGVAFQDLARTRQAVDSTYRRLAAVQGEIGVRKIREDEGSETIDVRLRAIIRGAEAEQSYYQNVVDYNKAITAYELRKGTLLSNSGIILAEGGWDICAYDDAQYNNTARLHANPVDKTYHSPAAFSVDAPFNGVYFTTPDSTAAEPVEAAPLVEPVPTEATPPMEQAPAPPMTIRPRDESATAVDRQAKPTPDKITEPIKRMSMEMILQESRQATVPPKEIKQLATETPRVPTKAESNASVFDSYSGSFIWKKELEAR